MELASIAVVCQGSSSPLQAWRPSVLTFLIDIFYHTIALKADILFHTLRIIACETLIGSSLMNCSYGDWWVFVKQVT